MKKENPEIQRMVCNVTNIPMHINPKVIFEDNDNGVFCFYEDAEKAVVKRDKEIERLKEKYMTCIDDMVKVACDKNTAFLKDLEELKRYTPVTLEHTKESFHLIKIVAVMKEIKSGKYVKYSEIQKIKERVNK